MDTELQQLNLGTQRSPRRWQALGALLLVGVVVTAAIFLFLGHFAAPVQVAASDPGTSEIEDPFSAEQPQRAPSVSEDDKDACSVMHRAIEDINLRMSEGVTENQARYFRSRRQKLYLMMQEKCGV